MVKTFEQYNNQFFLNLQDVEKYLNNRKMMLLVNNLINGLPESWRLNLSDYFQNEINIDQLFKYNKKLKIIEKTIKLYKNGIKNIKDIYNKIVPKNESIFIAISIILLVVGVLLCFIGFWYFLDDEISLKKWIMIISLFIIGVGTIFLSVKLYPEQEETKEIIINIKMDQKKHTVVIRMDENGEYTVEEINEGDW